MSEVQRLERELSNLRGSFNYYVEVREKAKQKRDEAKNRRDKIKALNNDLKWDFDGNSRSINNAVNKIDNDINKGIKGNRVASSIMTIIQADQEKVPEDDSDLRNAINNLTYEYNELDSYYQQKKGEILSAQSQINSLNWKIKEKEWELNKAKAAEWFNGE